MRSKMRNHRAGDPIFLALAGAGIKPGFTVGQTDEYGVRAVEGSLPANDLHARLLHLLGLNHEWLTYPVAGRDVRVTHAGGRVATEFLA